MEYSNKLVEGTEEIFEEFNASASENNMENKQYMNSKRRDSEINRDIQESSLQLNIQASDDELKTYIDELFNSVEYEKLISDINYVKGLFGQLLPSTLSNEGKSILILYILNGYSLCVDVNLVSAEVKGYLNKLCLALLLNLNFADIFGRASLLQLFNILLQKYFISDNELITNMLFESFIRFKTICDFENKISYFQVFTIKELYKSKMYGHISQLVELFNIDEFDLIIDNELIKTEIFSYFHKLSYSLILSNHYERAYNILTVAMLSDFNLIKIKEFQNMLAELVFLSLILNVKSSNPNLVIIKYKSKMSSKLLSVFQSYQASDFETFVCNFHLYILMLQSKKKEHLARLYNKESLIFLTHQLLQSKFEFLSKKLSLSLIMKRQDDVNLKIVNMNSIFQSYDLELPPFQYKSLSSEKNSNSIDKLVSDVDRLADINRSIKELSQRIS